MGSGLPRSRLRRGPDSGLWSRWRHLDNLALAPQKKQKRPKNGCRRRAKAGTVLQTASFRLRAVNSGETIHAFAATTLD